MGPMSPLYTDATVTGSLKEGPYHFLLTHYRASGATSIRPGIVLRVENYLDPSAVDITPIVKSDSKRYHGGWLKDEIAALVALSLGIRLKAGDATRRFDSAGDPRGIPELWGPNEPPFLRGSGLPILPGALGHHSLLDTKLFASLPALSPLDAVTLVRVARLYQDALWIAESEPQLSWLMLVSAVETAANYRQGEEGTTLSRLRAAKPDFAEYVQCLGVRGLERRIADEFEPSLRSTKKFISFCLDFLPAPPKARPGKEGQVSWARADMKKSLGTIYEHRSGALHNGIPFPLPMCRPPGRFEGLDGWDAPEERPPGFAARIGNAAWTAKDTPMLLHTFDHIARHALLKWWASMAPHNAT